jgi:hypothetical protein
LASLGLAQEVLTCDPIHRKFHTRDGIAANGWEELAIPTNNQPSEAMLNQRDHPAK